MSTKKSVQEWRDAISTLRRYASDFKYMRDKVFPRLKLSYDNLPNETEKSCFLYCALYPEDHSIYMNSLVDLWIAEGFLDGFDKLDEARDRGHTIIGSLKSACMLESSGKHRVKMHDVIRDLALWIVNDCRSSDQSGSSDNKFLVAGKDPCKKWENAERIFWDAIPYTTRNSNENPPVSSNLLTLIVQKTCNGTTHSNEEDENPPRAPFYLGTWIEEKTYNGTTHTSDMSQYWVGQRFFQHMPLLRVLDLSYAPASDDEFPITSICELHELQYLNLSGTLIDELPAQMRKLVKLKFLVLRNTWELRNIPAGVIANLSELQVLDTGCEDYSSGFEDWELEDGPSFRELDGLKQLQEVRISIRTDVALEKFLCNRKLQMVCTGLSIIGSSSRRVLDLSNFKNLKELVLYGGFLETEELVLLSNLETLSLNWFPKLNNILWTQPRDLLCSHFQSLHFIYMARCDALKDLNWLAYVENLKTLDVRKCKGLETIIELGDDHGLEEGTAGGRGDQMLNTGGGGTRVFRRLETLNLIRLPKLKSICRHASAFPSIETITICYCPGLKKLPLGSGSNVNNTLKWIEGEEEWWNELQWVDETIKSKFLTYCKDTYHIPGWQEDITDVDVDVDVDDDDAAVEDPAAACRTM